MRRLAAIRNHLRSIFLPERQPQATDARRPKDPALAKRRRRVAAHALETGALMIAFAALLPAAITAITIILRGPEDNFLNHSWETIVGLRGASVNGQAQVPGFGQVEVPTLCGVDHWVGRSPPWRWRAWRMRYDWPLVTTVVAWCSRRSSIDTAVVCSGRKRPQSSKEWCEAMPRDRRS